jgi:hypothetical protein
VEKPRWAPEEIEALQNEIGRLPSRSPAAAKKYFTRHCRQPSEDTLLSDEQERTSLTVTRVAADLGHSRASVYRLLNNGVLRRFKGGIAETSFSDLLREHPECMVRRLFASEKEMDRVVCANVCGLCWREASRP